MTKLFALIARTLELFTKKQERTLNIYYITKSGKNKGTIQKPHKHENGKYVVSMTRFEADYIEVDSYDEITEYMKQGYRVRMSSNSPKTAPSLVTPASIVIE